jgi:hypothetical protein
MKTRLCLALLIPIAMPVLTFAQSAFDGTWKMDLKSMQFPKKTDEFLLQDGMYHCKSCTPPVNIKADRQDQKVTGAPYYDTLSMKIVDNNTVEASEKKDGKLIGTSKETVSADGNTLTMEFTNLSSPNGEAIRGKFQETRLVNGPSDAHAISGSWRPDEMEGMGENAPTFTLKIQDDTLTCSMSMGPHYSAKLDGSDAPYYGDPGANTVSVKRVDDKTLEETDKRDGKVRIVQRITLSPDGKSLAVVTDDKLAGTKSEFKAIKQ